MQFDRQKLKEALHFVIRNCRPENLGAVKINKVLYYADMISYAVNGAPMTGAIYRKRPFGPASDQILFALRDLALEGKIRVSESDYFGYSKKAYESSRESSIERLSTSDLALLNEVIEFVCEKNTAKTIS